MTGGRWSQGVGLVVCYLLFQPSSTIAQKIKKTVGEGEKTSLIGWESTHIQHSRQEAREASRSIGKVAKVVLKYRVGTGFRVD